MRDPKLTNFIKNIITLNQQIARTRSTQVAETGTQVLARSHVTRPSWRSMIAKQVASVAAARFRRCASTQEAIALWEGKDATAG